jgi:UDP-N-acetylmuramoyl-tripeptide--D-alanyl-D-alanine ligase
MLSVNEILKSTRGKLLSGSADKNIGSFSIDTRTIKKGDAFIAIKGDNFDGHNFIGNAIKQGASCIIAGPKTKAKASAGAAFIEVKNTQDALADIGRALRVKYNIPVIAVTGSAGKTTVKDMLTRVLSAKFKVLSNEGTKNNHIGLPLTLCGLNDSYDIAVLELGTNHFGEIKNLTDICLPNAGVITHIGPAHLEHFNDLKGVFKEKYTLIENLRSPCLAILNSDDALLHKNVLKTCLKPFVLSFGIRAAADFSASHIRYGEKGIEFLLNGKHKFHLHTAGANNVYNALAAVAVARAFGMEYQTICRRLADFSFPKGRLNLRFINKVKFIDDTYNSNPLSLKQALDALQKLKPAGRKIFVMGDMLELGEAEEQFHREAGFNSAGICDIFITVGTLSRLAAKAAAASGLKTKNIFTCANASEARNILVNKISLKEGDIVLVKGSRAMRMEEILNVI